MRFKVSIIVVTLGVLVTIACGGSGASSSGRSDDFDQIEQSVADVEELVSASAIKWNRDQNAIRREMDTWRAIYSSSLTANLPTECDVWLDALQQLVLTADAYEADDLDSYRHHLKFAKRYLQDASSGSCV